MFHNSCSLKTVLADVNWGLKCWFNTVKSVSQRPLWGSRGFRCEKLSLDFINASRSRYHSLCSAEHIYYILFQCWFPRCKKGQWQNQIIQKRTHVRKSGVWKVCFMRNKGSRYDYFFKESKLSSWNYQRGNMLLVVPCESHSVVSDPVIPWTIQSMKFSRPEYWSG